MLNSQEIDASTSCIYEQAFDVNERKSAIKLVGGLHLPRSQESWK